jgi:hypothetical protein
MRIVRFLNSITLRFAALLPIFVTCPKLLPSPCGISADDSGSGRRRSFKGREIDAFGPPEGGGDLGCGEGVVSFHPLTTPH